MNRFDSQTLAQSGSDGKTFVMIFEDANGGRFTLTVPNQVALAMIPILEMLKEKEEPAFASGIMALEWRTARDQDSPTVVLQVRGKEPIGFPLNHAKALWQQVRGHCDEIEKRPSRPVS